RIATRAYMLLPVPANPPKGSDTTWSRDLAAWEPLVGRRRLAIILLKEAELLALRLPQLAIAGFRAAASMYEGIEEPVGRFFATTAMGLALMHAGADDWRRTTAKDLEAAYTELQRKRALAKQLPTWKDVSDAARRSRREPLTRLADDSWGPWIE